GSGAAGPGAAAGSAAGDSSAVSAGAGAADGAGAGAPPAHAERMSSTGTPVAAALAAADLLTRGAGVPRAAAAASSRSLIVEPLWPIERGRLPRRVGPGKARCHYGWLTVTGSRDPSASGLPSGPRTVI